MKTTTYEQSLKLILLLMTGVSMSACSGLSGHTKSWKEEVQLNDGRVIVAERFFSLGGYRGFESRERAEQDQTITFTLPGTGKLVSWKTEYRDDIAEPNSLTPLLLDVISGAPYLATSPVGCIAYNKWGRPNPPYILFKYVNDTWQRIALEDFPPVLISPNILPEPESRLIKPYYTKEETKKERGEGNRPDHAKAILRAPVKNLLRGCPEMVYYKGVWVGPGDSIGKRMMDSRSK